ncbi:MAG TPA: hypothetical protein VLV78_17395 [Thermoanaerobaculia bacterium]|nr:hypothetical protein [Thermoanaerobaculia bacterium]
MKRLLVLSVAIVLLAACKRNPVPTDRQLWRIEGEWVTPRDANVRTVLATIVVFRSSGEFVERHCRLIEQPDTTVYIASTGPQVVAVGVWKQSGAVVTATRQKILRSARVAGPEPLCDHPHLTFRVEGNVVSGESGTYAPVTRLVAPDFESYVNEAKRSSVTCTSASD